MADFASFAGLSWKRRLSQQTAIVLVMTVELNRKFYKFWTFCIPKINSIFFLIGPFFYSRTSKGENVCCILCCNFWYQELHEAIPFQRIADHLEKCWYTLYCDVVVQGLLVCIEMVLWSVVLFLIFTAWKKGRLHGLHCDKKLFWKSTSEAFFRMNQSARDNVREFNPINHTLNDRLFSQCYKECAT